MAGAEIPRRLTWQLARVTEVITETADSRSIVLDVPGWPGHRAGQHVDVRLTAPDGYQAQRGYSIASGPEDEGLVLTVERVPGGEVSPYFVDDIRPGDEFEIRGPIGGYFVWEEALGGPVLLLAGGSGIVPLRAILRHRLAIGSDVPVRLLYSVRSLDQMIFKAEMVAAGSVPGVDVAFALTREWPPDWAGFRGRVDAAALGSVSWPVEEGPLIYVCGPTGFVEAMSSACVNTGHPPQRIRTERFGPTGRR